MKRKFTRRRSPKRPNSQVYFNQVILNMTIVVIFIQYIQSSLCFYSGKSVAARFMKSEATLIGVVDREMLKV